MPESAPGKRYRAVATKATSHGAPAVEKGHPGIAFKSQQPVPAYPTPANALAAQQIAVSEAFLIDMLGLHEVDVALLPGGAVEGQALWINQADNTLAASGSAKVAASLVTGIVGSNNAIKWTARALGADANAITVTIVDPGGTTATLGVDVDGNDITVTLGRASSAINSTAADVIAAVHEHDTASQLVTAANSGASTGAGLMAAVTQTHLAGGADSGGGAIKFGRISYIDSVLGRAQVNLNIRDTF